VDGGHAEAEPLGHGSDGQEALGSKELGPPQIRRNLLCGRRSIPSIGWILWQGFYGAASFDSSVVESLRSPATTFHGEELSGRRFGTNGSQVQVLSPRLEGRGVIRDTRVLRGPSPC
jgi:hypothetical protein